MDEQSRAHLCVNSQLDPALPMLESTQEAEITCSSSVDRTHSSRPMKSESRQSPETLARRRGSTAELTASAGRRGVFRAILAHRMRTSTPAFAAWSRPHAVDRRSGHQPCWHGLQEVAPSGLSLNVDAPRLLWYPGGPESRMRRSLRCPVRTALPQPRPS